MLHKAYNDKTVLITGHTGFKGAWLTAWLKQLGANVVGVSLSKAPTEPSHFIAADLGGDIIDYRIDIRDSIKLEEVILSIQPDFVFHLAAQALVRSSYDDPVETWQINVLGTLHVLEALRKLDKTCAAVIITSDKCYDNVEWVWGYRETDMMGGPDPYSASKGAAELAIRSHIKSYFPMSSKVRIASARAGNVIGGGDWAQHRIIPDCVRAWSVNNVAELRNPHSTRPWQHVLEPLSGYLTLAISLLSQSELHGQPFNFGPLSQQNHSVLNLVEQMALYWSQVQWRDVSEGALGPYESGLLKLNCDKALHYLQWHAVMGFEETVRMTAEWYCSYYKNTEKICEVTKAQIAAYTDIAKQRGLKWAK